MGTPTSPAVMRDALMAARKVVALDMTVLLHRSCKFDGDDMPIIDSIKPANRAPYLELRQVVRQIDTALGRRGKGVRRGV